MPCNLIFAAKDFSVDNVVAVLHFTPYRIWRQGEMGSRRSERLFPDSGFLFTVSEADFDSFEQQITDVISFITAHQRDLCEVKDLMKELKEPDLKFDFGIETRMFDVGVQVNFLPAELLALCASIGAGIKITQYHPSSDKGEESAN